jgi:hypothetical protein
MTKLSILIPHLYSRKESLDILIDQLSNQIRELDAFDLIQILVDGDNGEKTIGRKRNDLLFNAEGEYISFVDDDDKVSDTYIKDLLHGISFNPDVLSLIGVFTERGKTPQTFMHSMHYQGWYEKDKILFRYINHLNCIKIDYAKMAGFPETSFGEDKIYSDRLLQLGVLKDEYTVNNVLYYYDYIPNKK